MVSVAESDLGLNASGPGTECWPKHRVSSLESRSFPVNTELHLPSVPQGSGASQPKSLDLDHSLLGPDFVQTKARSALPLKSCQLCPE